MEELDKAATTSRTLKEVQEMVAGNEHILLQPLLALKDRQ